MTITLIGDYEVTVESASEPALILHHLVRGYDVVRLSGLEAAAVAHWLENPLKRIRELSQYRVIIGAAGDVTWYLPNGLRIAYLTIDQARTLVQLLKTQLPPSEFIDDNARP